MLFEEKNVRVSNHCVKQILAKGFDPEMVRRAIEHPEKVTEVTAKAGQVRACGYGVAVVLAPFNNGKEWMAMTAYKDGVPTPVREDQKDDPRALASTRVAMAQATA